jgi:hypothetical protein
MTSTELDLDDHHDPWPSIALEDDYYYSLLVIVTASHNADSFIY